MGGGWVGGGGGGGGGGGWGVGGGGGGVGGGGGGGTRFDKFSTSPMDTKFDFGILICGH